MTSLLQWSYFIVVPFAAACITLIVWVRSEIKSFALISGTLAGAALSLGISSLFWSDVDAYQSHISEDTH